MMWSLHNLEFRVNIKYPVYCLATAICLVFLLFPGILFADTLAAFEKPVTNPVDISGQTAALTGQGDPASEKNDLTQPNFEKIEAVQAGLADETALLVYANSGRPKIIQMVLTRSELIGLEVSKDSFLSQSKSLLGHRPGKNFDKLRGLKPAKNRDYQESVVTEQNDSVHSLDEVVTYYRTLITSLPREKGYEQQLFQLSRLLHDLLILPLQARISGKKELVIIPDGVLAFVPFETLIDPDGAYLVEKYRIRYAPSLAVLNQLKNRNYSTLRKPMLAFGGAVYEDSERSDNTIQNASQLAAFKNEVFNDLSRGVSLKSSYKALALADWKNIPGSLREVKSIGRIISDADILTNDQVSETRVKQLSADGELSKYRILHFATHGVTVPEVPELSAIVLSQLKNDSSGEDGYLQMAEIAKLGIKADFVNLSACDTGLGKIYGGEGVVGLVQSFLIAGANSLSVSLWSVADESTGIFMENLYRQADNEKITYLEALNRIKRQFIRGEFGEKYRLPFYWGAFVFYGRSD